MGKYVITNGKILFNGYDLSGDHNQIGLTVSREEREATTLGNVGVQRLAGLQSFDVSGSGFFEAGAGSAAAGNPAHIDTVIAPQLGTSGVELTILPQGTSVGSKGFIGEISTFEYAPGGSIGDVMGFTFAGKGEGTMLVEGTVLKSGAVSTSGVGTAFNLGSATGHTLYTALHVTSTSGVGSSQEILVSIQSDSAENFPTPTDRIAFTAVGASVISYWKSTTASVLADPWWRAKWLPVGTGKSFTFYLTAGISYL